MKRDWSGEHFPWACQVSEATEVIILQKSLFLVILYSTKAAEDGPKQCGSKQEM